MWVKQVINISWGGGKIQNAFQPKESLSVSAFQDTTCLKLAAEQTAVIFIASFSYKESHNKGIMTLKSMAISYMKEAFGHLPSVKL